jgi:hypothetical protein
VRGAEALRGAGGQRLLPGHGAGLVVPALGLRRGLVVRLDLHVLVLGHRRRVQHLQLDGGGVAVVHGVAALVGALVARADEAARALLLLGALAAHADQLVAAEGQALARAALGVEAPLPTKAPSRYSCSAPAGHTPGGVARRAIR